MPCRGLAAGEPETTRALGSCQRAQRRPYCSAVSSRRQCRSRSIIDHRRDLLTHTHTQHMLLDTLFFFIIIAVRVFVAAYANIPRLRAGNGLRINWCVYVPCDYILYTGTAISFLII